jgi:hypothetical protein
MAKRRAKRRAATRVILTDAQRERLERLWFIYGNHGPKTTPGNHQFIQGLLEHGLDLRPLQTKRTAKRDIPTDECVAAVEAAMSSKDGGGEGGGQFRLPRLVSSPGDTLKTDTPDPELKKMLDEMRRRISANLDRGALDPGGKNAA